MNQQAKTKTDKAKTAANEDCCHHNAVPNSKHAAEPQMVGSHRNANRCSRQITDSNDDSHTHLPEESDGKQADKSSSQDGAARQGGNITVNTESRNKHAYDNICNEARRKDIAQLAAVLGRLMKYDITRAVRALEGAISKQGEQEKKCFLQGDWLTCRPLASCMHAQLTDITC